MVEIFEALPKQFSIIQKLAHEIWPPTFEKILSAPQISYMLEMMYSLPNLEKQHQKGHHFILLKEDELYLGFASYELNYEQSAKTKIHKIYVLPQKQGKGLGKTLLDFIAQIALENQNDTLTLNVNRFNGAVNFYERIGFKKTATEDIDIGNGFLMEDFVMEKPLR